MRLLLTLQYLGTRYAGWQTQANATGIQQVVERALSTMFQSETRIEGAGRTDSGVHARAQRAHVSSSSTFPPTRRNGPLDDTGVPAATLTGAENEAPPSVDRASRTWLRLSLPVTTLLKLAQVT